MEDASPPKWHLAHTSWFFETFLLKPHAPGYTCFDPRYETLFNSYYNGVGQPFPRPQRGFLSRPTVADIFAYRKHVDEHMTALLKDPAAEVAELCTLGLNHEQQHQELLLTDLKYNFGHNPLAPVYGGAATSSAAVPVMGYTDFQGGLTCIGQASDSKSFKFDNECPRHEAMLAPFKLANRLVSNGEYLSFMQDGGYQNPALWLSEGWDAVQSQQWQAPLYWRSAETGTGVTAEAASAEQLFEYRLDGLQPLDPDLPVTHISAHEAFAYATWADARLPTEYELEVALGVESPTGDDAFVESARFHPGGYQAHEDMQQLHGHVWQWTQSSYCAYPGFKPLPGTLGEYNGKFMSSQLVLRGGSCATPREHVRPTYRNFFYPPDRWQFSGLRLAQDA